MFGSEKLMYNAGSDFYPKTLDGSLRFNDADTAYLSRTLSTAGNRKTWTFSAWVKRGNIGSSGDTIFLGGDNSNNAEFARLWFVADTLRFSYFNDYWFITNRVFRDASAWYHICLKFDTTQAVASDRITLYVNGIKVSDFSIENYPAQNSDQGVNFNDTHYIGASSVNSSIRDKFDGYMSEVHFTDGTAYDADAFGEFKSGVWVAKEPSVTYGTNGFYLPLSSDSNDDSGNGNNWTQNNLASTDFVLDSPTNNFATFNPLINRWILNSTTFSQGNLQASSSQTSNYQFATIESRGSFYFELFILNDNIQPFIAVSESGRQTNTEDVIFYYGANGSYGISEITGTISGYTTGDVIALAYNTETGEATFYKNGTSVLSGTGDMSSFNTFIAGSILGYNDAAVINFGQDSSFAGNKTAQGNTDANGIGDFYYAPPTGYLALCTANLPEPVFSPADDESPQDHFNTVLYSGDGTSSHAITGVGFQPDFLWIKNRILANPHITQNVITGADTHLQTSSTGAEQTDTTLALSFDTDGFTVGSNQAVNESSRSYVAWNWKAGGAGVSNTDGSITSTLSANVDAGFSIVSYIGNGSTGSVGHGLDRDLDFVIIKNRDQSSSWVVQRNKDNVQKYLYLNDTRAESTSTAFQIDITRNNDGTFFLGSNDKGVNLSGDDYIAYCFHSVDGFSKFGSYTGNGSADGPFIYTGFRPAFVLIKRIDSAQNWTLSDYKRSPENTVNKQLYPSATVAELNESDHDYLSNGFKVRNSGGNMNTNGGTYIYMAFAENPFKYSNAR